MIRRPMCLLCLIFMVGIWVMDVLEVPQSREPSENPVILQYLLENPQEARIYGQIYRRTPDGSAVYLKNSYLNVRSELLSLENVKVYMEESRNPGESLPVGAGVVMTGKLQKIPPPGNPGQFDSVLYYKTQHIYYRMVKGRGEVKNLPKYSYRETLEQIRGRLSESLTWAAGEYAPIYQAMLLGDKSQLEEEVKDRYQMAGMLHMLAISGLHLSLLGMGCFQILNRLGASIPLAGSLSVFLLFSYGILTGEGVATMRALCMFVLVMGGKLLGRTYDLLSALALSALLLLLDSPYYLFYSGFLLSFGCICGIGMILPRLRKILVDVARYASFLRDKSPTNWEAHLAESNFQTRSRHRRCSIALVNALGASLSIQMATLPITLYFFYEYPVYGILLNLAAIPALSAVLVSGMFGSFLGLFSAGIGHWAVLPGNLLLKGYDLLGILAQKLPMTTWVAGQPDLWQIIIYYLLLIAALALARSEERNYGEKKPLREVVKALLGGTGIFLGVLILGISPRGELSITCLEVGQGDCLAVTTPENHHYLIDGGSSNLQEAGRYRILPYLKSQGISRLDYVWISHTDGDHISGILELLKLQQEERMSLTIENLLLPAWEERPDTYLELERMAREAGTRIHYMKEGDTLKDGEVSWNVLSPGNIQSGDVNEDALVFLLEYGKFRGLFTGDIGTGTEERLLEQLPDVDVLKVAHHGSKNSTGDAFLARIRPEIALISCSSTNTYGHPNPDTLARLENAGSRIWCTKDKGAVTVISDGRKIKIHAFLH